MKPQLNSNIKYIKDTCHNATECEGTPSKLIQDRKRELFPKVCYGIAWVAILITGIGIYGFVEEQRIFLAALSSSGWWEKISVNTLYYMACATTMVGVVLYLVSLAGWEVTSDSKMVYKGLKRTVLVFFLILVMLAGLILIQLIGAKASDAAKNLLVGSKMTQILTEADRHIYDQDSQAYQRLDALQSVMKCCGVSGPRDWKNSTLAPLHSAEEITPNSCSDYQVGCMPAVSEYTYQQETCLLVIFGGIVFFSVIQMYLLLQMIWSFIHLKKTSPSSSVNIKRSGLPPCSLPHTKIPYKRWLNAETGNENNEKTIP